MDPIVTIHSLSHRYGNIEALTGVSLEVPRGFFALLGPNGAGKTTLVSLLATLLPIQIGEAVVAGYSVQRQPSQVRQILGMVFQEPSLDERLTLLENLHFHALIYRVPAHTRGLRIKEALELVDLSEWANAPVRALSRGMKRRLEIARALLHSPRLLILDEPTVGLDVQGRRRIWQYLEGLRQEGVCLLLTTHQLEEAETADRVAIIDQGRVIVEGSPLELRQRYGRPSVLLGLEDNELEGTLLKHFGENARKEEGLLRISLDDPKAFLSMFIPQHGSALTSLQVVYPSLEDVFLLLTGRALREGAGDRREATLAFAKAGGEHTR
ncbi:MAG: ABC transporter ATP-binding protein [Meiothermus silvanus]|nr:ABC transporter ATP-binding protein [Allomeiothermus silvanus]